MPKYRIIEDRFGKFHIEQKFKVPHYSLWATLFDLKPSRYTRAWRFIDSYGNSGMFKVGGVYNSLEDAKEQLKKIMSKDIIHYV